MGQVGEQHAGRVRGTAVGEQASGGAGQDASVGFDGGHAMPGQGRGPAPLAHQGSQPGQGRCPDGDEVRTGLLPGIGRRPAKVLDQLVQRALRRFASLPQMEEVDQPGIIGRQQGRVQPGLVRIRPGRGPGRAAGEADWAIAPRPGTEERIEIAHRRRLLAQGSAAWNVSSMHSASNLA